jgi:aminoglycoside 3-N-acetyltransferase
LITVLKSLMRSHFPDFSLKCSNYFFDLKRLKTRIVWRIAKKEISGEVLAKQLRLSAMLKAGDILMVHASLSAIGKVIGGAETVIHSLQNVLTEDGTLLMPSYHQPEPVINMIKSGALVDLRNAKSTVGNLTEVFRLAQGVKRSSHPYSSVCAWGKYSQIITQGHANSEVICGPGSPLDVLYELSGKIMGIGISIAWISIYHLLEDKWEKFPIEVHFSETYSVNYIITKHMIEKNILREFSLGQARSWIFDVKLFYEELKNLTQQGITIYTTKEQYNKI